MQEIQNYIKTISLEFLKNGKVFKSSSKLPVQKKMFNSKADLFFEIRVLIQENNRAGIVFHLEGIDSKDFVCELIRDMCSIDPAKFKDRILSELELDIVGPYISKLNQEKIWIEQFSNLEKYGSDVNHLEKANVLVIFDGTTEKQYGDSFFFTEILELI